MSRISMTFLVSSVCLALFCVAYPSAIAQAPAKPNLITQRIDESNLVQLSGNTRPEVRSAKDLGAVPSSLVLNHMYLLLKRSPEQQEAADDLMDQLHDPNSGQYHHWLTASQVAERFGPSDEDVRTITGWLTSHGFTINFVYPADGVIDFSGPASSVHGAFHTRIHYLDVHGKRHLANMSDPEIPAALADAIRGVVSMNDFHPHPLMIHVRPRPLYTDKYGEHPLVPGDIHTIYNMNPIYAAGITGKGQTIAVLEDSDFYANTDWQTFRQAFGLAQFSSGSLIQVHPQPSTNPANGGSCADPGTNANEGEAALDVEWASAAAPNAAIIAATCADTNVNFGGFIAMQNIITGPGPKPNIINISYHGPESEIGAAFNAYINVLYQTAVFQGISVYVAAGDGGAADTDTFSSAAVSGINVNGFASTPNDTAVGGTDFADSLLNESATYWTASNGSYFNSARSYIPEIPWNQSCANSFAAARLGFLKTYGTSGFCNSPLIGTQYFFVGAGGGGPSACAFGSPEIPGVVGGTCSGYAKPLYQRLVSGNHSDRVRDLPDVALYSGSFPSFPFHYYIYCLSDPNPASGGNPCVGAPVSDGGWSGATGTSFASPIMAGIQALINEATGSNQGNPDYVYYLLAAAEYDFGGGSSCNSTGSNKNVSNCIFHDITIGSNDVNCLPLAIGGSTVGTFNCYIPSGTNGVLSRSNSHYDPAFPATPGWDFATGLGSVNAYNLVKDWPGSRLH